MTVLLLLLTAHFAGDFVLQTDWMALNKSRRWDALALHVAVYSACFLLWGWRFAAITFAAHFVQDAITSRINRLLSARPSRRLFFVGIGADQLLHAWALAGTWWIVRAAPLP